eukprot:2922509-Prymnesium_polylepis.2
MEAWRVSPQQRTAARCTRSARVGGRGRVGMRARQGCARENRAQPSARRACAAPCHGEPGVSPLLPRAHRTAAAARERVRDVQREAHVRRERATRARMPERALRPSYAARARAMC